MATEANSRHMVTALFNSLPSTRATDHISNPLKNLPKSARNTFLTLYALFEKEMLPALDLLDRNLVTRIKTQSRPGYHERTNHSKLYLVRSAQPQASRNSQHECVNGYEVRLSSWTCSCPAFTFAAFPANSEMQSEAPSVSGNSSHSLQAAEWAFGGLSLGSDMPTCKHLLACILVEHCQMFSGCVDEKEVSLEDLAGWAAGWGD